MPKISVLYKLKDMPERSFSMMVERDITCQSFLQKISEKMKKEYVALFFEGSVVDPEDEIFDFWDSDPQYIFFASLDSEPPSPEVIQMGHYSQKSSTQDLAPS